VASGNRGAIASPLQFGRLNVAEPFRATSELGSSVGVHVCRSVRPLFLRS
jgi:hypothetical protein